MAETTAPESRTRRSARRFSSALSLTPDARIRKQIFRFVTQLSREVAPIPEADPQSLRRLERPAAATETTTAQSWPPTMPSALSKQHRVRLAPVASEKRPSSSESSASGSGRDRRGPKSEQSEVQPYLSTGNVSTCRNRIRMLLL